MTNSNLEFRKIKSLNFLYEVNSNGTIFRNVKSKKQNKIILDYHHSAKGYYFTWICRNHKVKRISIAKVVAECWHGEKPQGYEIDHIDRNSHNNDYRNLRYVTKSQQMKNRDHSKISARGSENFEKARRERMQPIKLLRDNTAVDCESKAAASRFLANIYSKNAEFFRQKLKAKRKHIYEYEVIYLKNAETGHARSTEQGTVQLSLFT